MQLRICWASWRDFNKPWEDITFHIDGTNKLQAMLTGEEATSLKCVWKHKLGDRWDQYLRTYTSGIAHLYLGVTPNKESYHLHDYRPVGNRNKA